MDYLLKLNEGKDESELTVPETLGFESLVYKKIRLEIFSESFMFSVPENHIIQQEHLCSDEGMECAGLLAVC